LASKKREIVPFISSKKNKIHIEGLDPNLLILGPLYEIYYSLLLIPTS